MCWSTPPPVRVTNEIFQHIIRHAREDAPRECCGLLAGRNDLISRVFPSVNAAEKPETSYEIAPREIFQHMRAMHATRLELLGIYHSHPKGKNEPSLRDVELAYYPETPYLIVSPLADEQRTVRAFVIQDGSVRELEIQIVA
jgi:[CysO sulfur-carrier protein]-S-L-cysteine hydrolase